MKIVIIGYQNYKIFNLGKNLIQIYKLKFFIL